MGIFLLVEAGIFFVVRARVRRKPQLRARTIVGGGFFVMAVPSLLGAAFATASKTPGQIAPQRENHRN